MSSMNIDWDSSQPLTEAEFHNVISAVVKKLLESALKAVVSGDVNYTKPYEVQGLLELLMKEFHLARGEPTEIRETRTVHVLPEDDDKAIQEGLRRMKQLSDRRKDRPLIEVGGEDDSSSSS